MGPVGDKSPVTSTLKKKTDTPITGSGIILVVKFLNNYLVVKFLNNYFGCFIYLLEN